MDTNGAAVVQTAAVAFSVVVAPTLAFIGVVHVAAAMLVGLKKDIKLLFPNKCHGPRWGT